MLAVRGLIARLKPLLSASTVKVTSSCGKRELSIIDCLKQTLICINVSFILGEKKQLPFWKRCGSNTMEQVNINQFIITELKIFFIIIIIIIVILLLLLLLSWGHASTVCAGQKSGGEAAISLKPMKLMPPY